MSTTHNHELHMQMLMNISTTVDPHANHNHHFHNSNGTTTSGMNLMDHHNSSHIHDNHIADNHHMLVSRLSIFFNLFLFFIFVKFLSKKMYMHGGFGSDYIVFYEWNPKTIGALVASCFFLIFISIFYEALKSFRSFVKATRFRRNLAKIDDKKSSIELNEISKDKSKTDSPNKSYINSILSKDHLIQTALHVFQFAISYFIMLSFMTYNYWYCLSILLGIGIGYFLFGVKVNSSRTDPVSTSSLSISSENFQDCHH